MMNTNQRSQNDAKYKGKTTISYKAPWNIFALGFSNKPQFPFRLGIGSCLPETTNERVSITHQFPATKLIFIPDQVGDQPDLLATSGENLKIYEIKDNKQATLVVELTHKHACYAPLTSFDWNPRSINLIGTSSIDATCTIWDIEKQSICAQLFDHDQEVNDIHFSNQKDLFASVSYSGQMRLIDLRDMEHSSVLYKTQGHTPIWKLSWNRKHLYDHLIALIEMQANSVTILDYRKPNIPLMKLGYHSDQVNCMAWVPESESYICTAGNDKEVFISQLPAVQSITDYHHPMLKYHAPAQITNLAWSTIQWIALCYNNNLEILKI